jgi:DNA-binding transcriptional regulator GbsR (MarR family)
MLKDVAVEVDSEDQTDPVTKERIQNMLQFVETTSDWYENIQAVPTPTLQKLMKLGTGITKALKK